VVTRAAPLTRSVLDAGDEEDHAHARIGDHVAIAVDPVVAGAVGQQQRRVVQHQHEAGRIAARAGVQPALVVGGGQHQERRQRDEGAAVMVEPRQLLLFRKAADVAVEIAQRRRVRDAVHRCRSPARKPQYRRARAGAVKCW
jgi:hypothetical protein